MNVFSMTVFLNLTSKLEFFMTVHTIVNLNFLYPVSMMIQEHI